MFEAANLILKFGAGQVSFKGEPFPASFHERLYYLNLQAVDKILSMIGFEP